MCSVGDPTLLGNPASSKRLSLSCHAGEPPTGPRRHRRPRRASHRRHRRPRRRGQPPPTCGWRAAGRKLIHVPSCPFTWWDWDNRQSRPSGVPVAASAWPGCAWRRPPRAAAADGARGAPLPTATTSALQKMRQFAAWRRSAAGAINASAAASGWRWVATVATRRAATSGRPRPARAV